MLLSPVLAHAGEAPEPAVLAEGPRELESSDILALVRAERRAGVVATLVGPVAVTTGAALRLFPTVIGWGDGVLSETVDISSLLLVSGGVAGLAAGPPWLLHSARRAAVAAGDRAALRPLERTAWGLYGVAGVSAFALAVAPALDARGLWGARTAVGVLGLSAYVGSAIVAGYASVHFARRARSREVVLHGWAAPTGAGVGARW